MCLFNTNSYIFINSQMQPKYNIFNSLKIANPVSQVGNTQQKVHFSFINIYIFYIFMHLADSFIQSDLQCIQVTVLFFLALLPWE